MVRKFGMGLDGGNTKVKAVSFVNGKPVIITFPSVSTDGSITTLSNARRADGSQVFPHDRDYLERGEYVFKLKNGGQLFIGDLAQRENARASSGRGDPNRYWSHRMLEYTLMSAAIAIEDEELNLYVVGGLPANTFDPHTSDRYINNLLGSHLFTLSGYERHLDGRERLCHIKNVKVLREGAGASLALAKREEGIQGFIDIGGYSTDLYVCDGLRPIGSLCTGVDAGVENIMDKVSGWYKEEYGVDADLSSKLRSEILRAYAHSTSFSYPYISAKQRSVSPLQLRSWVQQAVTIVGNQINEHIVQHWKSGEKGQAAVDFNHVYVVGGGSYYLMDHLKHVIDNPVRPDQPELKNVMGYGIYGNRMAHQSEVA